jgi:hypothetical protein
MYINTRYDTVLCKLVLLPIAAKLPLSLALHTIADTYTTAKTLLLVLATDSTVIATSSSCCI